MPPPPRPPAAPLTVAGSARKLAESTYRLGERLFACVDADYREWPKQARRPPDHLDVSKLELFRRRLRGAARGRAGRGLKRLEQAVREDRASRPEVAKPQSLLDDLNAETVPDLDELLEEGFGDEASREVFKAALGALKNTWTRRRRDRREPPPSGNNPHWRTDRLYRHPPCSRTGCAVCCRRAERDREAQAALGVNSASGPRDFWDIVAKNQDEAEGDKEIEMPDEPTLTLPAVEARLWRAVLLVRCHDRERGLRLNRDEPQRKLLDLRFYELCLLYLRLHVKTPKPPAPPAEDEADDNDEEDGDSVQ